MKLPTEVEQLTPEWVTEALQDRHPGARVRNVRPAKAMHGTASKVRLHLDYDPAGRNAGLPPTLIVKGGFSAHRELMYREYMLEARFYADIAPGLEGVRVPKCHFAGHDEALLGFVRMLRDVAEARGQGVRVLRVTQGENSVGQDEATVNPADLPGFIANLGDDPVVLVGALAPALFTPGLTLAFAKAPSAAGFPAAARAIRHRIDMTLADARRPIAEHLFGTRLAPRT